MKILIIAPYFFELHRWMISGYKTALCLSKKNKVVVLTTGKPFCERFNPNLKIYRMRDFFMPDPVNFSIVPGLLFYLLKVINKEKPDVFLVNKHMFYTSFSIFWLKILGKKVFTQVDTFPGIIWFSRNPLVNIVLWIYARTIGLFLLKISDKVILLHEGLIPTAKKYRLNYTVIHNGVDFNEIEKAKPASDISQRAEDELRVIYVGRLESVKGYEDLLAVAQKMIQTNPNVKFYFAGSIDKKKEIVKKFKNKQIVFLDHRSDIFSVLKTMDIFVLPSYSEGLPNALMEAMACGLVCVSSNVGGVKILIQDGITGRLFSPGDKKVLESMILQLTDDSELRMKLGKAAKEKILREFGWNQITKKYKLLFNELKK